MARQTNSDARRGTLLRFGHRASASSGLHERWSLIQPGRVRVPLCGMLLPFQAIPTQRMIEIENSVRGRQHAGHIQRLARQPCYGSRRVHRSWSGVRNHDARPCIASRAARARPGKAQLRAREDRQLQTSPAAAKTAAHAAGLAAIDQVCRLFDKARCDPPNKTYQGLPPCRSLCRPEGTLLDPETVTRLCAQAAPPGGIGIVAPTGKASSVLMFHGNLVHASPPNITPYPRKIGVSDAL